MTMGTVSNIWDVQGTDDPLLDTGRIDHEVKVVELLSNIVIVYIAPVCKCVTCSYISVQGMRCTSHGLIAGLWLGFRLIHPTHCTLPMVHIYSLYHL